MCQHYNSHLNELNIILPKLKFAFRI